MKKKIAPLVAVLPAWLLWASSLIIISILVLAIGAIIVYQLMNLCRLVIPQTSPQQTNSVTEQFYYERQQAVLASQPLTNLSQPAALSNGFQLQYGVESSDGLPWICAGTNYVAPTNTPVSGVLYTFENDTNCFDFVFQVGGQIYRATTFLDDPTGTVYTNNLSVVVECSQDLTNWTPLLTNCGCVLDTANDFCDTNPPPLKNFYRALYR